MLAGRSIKKQEKASLVFSVYLSQTGRLAESNSEKKKDFGRMLVDFHRLSEKAANRIYSLLYEWCLSGDRIGWPMRSCSTL